MVGKPERNNERFEHKQRDLRASLNAIASGLKANLNAITRGLSASSELGSERYKKQRATALSVGKRCGQPPRSLRQARGSEANPSGASPLAQISVVLARRSPTEKLAPEIGCEYMPYAKA